MDSLWRGKISTEKRGPSMRAAWKLRLLRLLSGTARPRTGILRSMCLASLHLSWHVVFVQILCQRSVLD